MRTRHQHIRCRSVGDFDGVVIPGSVWPPELHALQVRFALWPATIGVGPQRSIPPKPSRRTLLCLHGLRISSWTTSAHCSRASWSNALLYRQLRRDAIREKSQSVNLVATRLLDDIGVVVRQLLDISVVKRIPESIGARFLSFVHKPIQFPAVSHMLNLIQAAYSSYERAYKQCCGACRLLFRPYS